MIGDGYYPDPGIVVPLTDYNEALDAAIKKRGKKAQTKAKNKVKTVPVDDDLGMMLNWAVRYALGRRTYAVSATVDYIMPLVQDLNSKTLWCIERDIDDHIKRGWSLGDDCDRENWMQLLRSVKEEIERRAGN